MLCWVFGVDGCCAWRVGCVCVCWGARCGQSWNQNKYREGALDTMIESLGALINSRLKNRSKQRMAAGRAHIDRLRFRFQFLGCWESFLRWPLLPHRKPKPSHRRFNKLPSASASSSPPTHSEFAKPSEQRQNSPTSWTLASFHAHHHPNHQKPHPMTRHTPHTQHTQTQPAMSTGGAGAAGGQGPSWLDVSAVGVRKYVLMCVHMWAIMPTETILIPPPGHNANRNHTHPTATNPDLPPESNSTQHGSQPGIVGPQVSAAASRVGAAASSAAAAGQHQLEPYL